MTINEPTLVTADKRMASVCIYLTDAAACEFIFGAPSFEEPNSRAGWSGAWVDYRPETLGRDTVERLATSNAYRKKIIETIKEGLTMS